MQHVLVDDPPSHARHEFGVWNGVEVFRQIGRRRRPCSPDAAVHPPSGSHPAHSASTVAVSFGSKSASKIGSKISFAAGLRHPVPNGRDSERPLSAPGFGIVTSARAVAGTFCRAVPSRVRSTIPSVPLDPSTRWPRSSPHPLRRALVGLRQHVRVDQNVFAVYLVVELMKTESRLLLAFRLQFDPQVPDLIRRCQAHRHSPSFPASQTHQKQGPFPPPELPGFIGTSGPFRRPDGPPPFLAAFAVRDSATIPGLPTDARSLSGMLCSLPRWTESVRNGCCNGALPRRVLPDSFRLPRSCDGSASTLPLSRPARASHALRPARSLAHHTWTLSRGSSPPRFQDRPPASYRINHQLFEWVLPPLGISPFGAHARPPAPPSGGETGLTLLEAVEDAGDVVESFRYRRDTSGGIDAAGSGVIGGQRQGQVPSYLRSNCLRNLAPPGRCREDRRDSRPPARPRWRASTASSLALRGGTRHRAGSWIPSR